MSGNARTNTPFVNSDLQENEKITKKSDYFVDKMLKIEYNATKGCNKVHCKVDCNFVCGLL